MYISEIAIQGFKSFAKKEKIKFAQLIKPMFLKFLDFGEKQ